MLLLTSLGKSRDCFPVLVPCFGMCRKRVYLCRVIARMVRHHRPASWASVTESHPTLDKSQIWASPMAIIFWSLL